MKSLGYVECNGLSGAIVAADRMLKTADVELSSIQNTKGNGWVTLQVSGELSAVTVAVQAVKDYLPKVYVTSAVIGRPATGLNSLGKTDLLNVTPEKKQAEEIPVKPETFKPSSNNEIDDNKAVRQLAREQEKTGNNDEAQLRAIKNDNEPDTKQGNNDEVTCNMCGDPKCPRKLGEPHKKCIHYNELKKK